MTTELVLLCWTLLLALGQILLAGVLRTRELGMAWNLGPRDDPGPPTGTLTGRMRRAQHNLFETLPLFAAAVLTAHVAGREGPLTLWGTSLFLVCRVLFVPIYAAGIPVLRTVVWGFASLGMVLVIAACLLPA